MAQSTLFRPALIAVVIPIVAVTAFFAFGGRQNGSKLNCVNTLMAYTIIRGPGDISCVLPRLGHGNKFPKQKSL